MPQLSFRDPGGFVFLHGDRVLRCVLPHAVNDLRTFLSSTIAAGWTADGALAGSTILAAPSRDEMPAEVSTHLDRGAIVLEHPPIRFFSYPYEWPPEMLHAAAALTLSIAQATVETDFGLKDATPYNISFEAARPVFIDVLSFERRDPLDPLWRPYAQFIRTFVYPLLANRYFGVRLDEILLPNRDGLEPDRMLRLCPLWRLLLPPFLGVITMPAILSRGADGQPDRFRARSAKDPKEAAYLLRRLFKSSSRLLTNAFDAAPKKHASSYTEGGHNYSSPELAAKVGFVEDAMRTYRPKRVLDIGSNTGRFSAIAASGGAGVVAIDRDPDAAGMLWRTARRDNLDILPLVVDIARPPGACGWANREFSSFADRAHGKFDCVLMLALIHHLLVNERVPLACIFELAAELTTELAIVEYVGREDSQFQRLTRGREALHESLTRESFEAAAHHRFEIVESRELTPARRIYTLRKRHG